MIFVGTPSFQLHAFLLAFAVVSSTSIVSATTFNVVSRPRRDYVSPFAKRTDMSSYANHDDGTFVSNSGDLSYYSNITIGGVTVEVMIDTGSADLWTMTPVHESRNLTVPLEIRYAKGSAKGHLSTATVEFDDYVISDQAYIQVYDIGDFNPAGNGTGILGLGPSSGSLIRQKLNSTAGNTLLDRIFLENTTTPNYITVLLSRAADDAAGPDTIAEEGKITIGHPVKGLERVLDQPRIPALTDEEGRIHWQTHLLEVLDTDGEPVPISPLNSDSDHLRVMYDTGFTFPQVPREFVDGLYGRIPGAEYLPVDNTSGIWAYPCDFEVNVTFVFEGVQVPIAPLDLGITINSPEAEGYCLAAFHEINPALRESKGIDMILGMAFLRNAYLLVNFGDFVDGRPSSIADPYIQLLPITDVADAHSDFVKIRLDGVDTTATQPRLLSYEEGQTTPDQTVEPEATLNSNSKSTDSNAKSRGLFDDDDDSKPIHQRHGFIISLVACISLLLVGIIFAIVWVRHRRRRRSRVPLEVAFTPAVAGPSAYNPLAGSSQPRGHLVVDTRAHEFTRLDRPLVASPMEYEPRYDVQGHQYGRI